MSSREEAIRPSGGGPVIVTGYGVVGATGSGVDALAATFEHGELPLTEVDRSAGYHRRHDARELGARLAAQVPAAATAGLIPPRQARRMSPPSRFAVAAARQAVDMAGAEAIDSVDEEAGAVVDSNPPSGRTAVISSTAFGPSSFTEELLRQIFLDQPAAASPFLFTEAVANAPAAQIALALRATGPNLTVTQREAGPLQALAHGGREILRGRADRALVVAVDECNPLLHAALDRAGVLAGSRGGEEVARPFDMARRGFVLAEGATALLLESEARVRARGLPGPWWTLRGHIAAFDPSAPPSSWGRQPETLAASLRQGLRRLDVNPADVDAVVCGANGSGPGDVAEAAVLRALWPGRMPPVLVPKAYTGEHGGGLLAGLAWLLHGGRWMKPPGFRQLDPRCDVVPFGDGNPAPGLVLAGALAVGGAAAWTVLERIDP